MDHPETEVVEEGEEDFIHFNRLTPIYPLTEGLPQRWLRSLIWRTLAQLEAQIAEPWPQVQKLAVAGCRLRCLKRSRTVKKHRSASHVHSATALARPRPGDSHAALPGRRSGHRSWPGAGWRWTSSSSCNGRFSSAGGISRPRPRRCPCGGDNHLIKPFLARLGFKLTEAQTKVLRELRQDLSGPHPMRGLLQGDVGSGKTVVAACCALMALESGYNVALMAPTEILAEQHFRNFTNWLEPLGVSVVLQTGSRKTGDREQPASSSLHSAPRPRTTQTALPGFVHRDPLHRHARAAHGRLRAARTSAW